MPNGSQLDLGGKRYKPSATPMRVTYGSSRPTDRQQGERYESSGTPGVSFGSSQQSNQVRYASQVGRADPAAPRFLARIPCSHSYFCFRTQLVNSY
jgi:hypothetical protein